MQLKRRQDYLKKNKLKLKVEVETRNLAEVEEAGKLAGKGIDRIMLDNMDVKTMTEAVKIIAWKMRNRSFRRNF